MLSERRQPGPIFMKGNAEGYNEGYDEERSGMRACKTVVMTAHKLSAMLETKNG